MRLERHTRRWRPATLPQRPDTDETEPGAARPVLRFAPSPNGPLHLGHALSALSNLDMARALGGRLLVRIEDIDLARSREAHVTAIFEDLAWLGLRWEEPVLRQSEHFAVYQRASADLLKAGLLYPCFASRAEIAEAAKHTPDARDPDGAPLYPGLHKNLSREDVAARLAAGETFALRLHMDRALNLLERQTGSRRIAFTELTEAGLPQTIEADPTVWGDAVIVRKDIPASYALAVVVDDARQGVTHVVRGRDLYAATSLQRLLQVLLGLPQPVYHHHRLLMGSDGRKLSKSAGAASLAGLRRQGVTATEVLERVGAVHQAQAQAPHGGA